MGVTRRRGRLLDAHSDHASAALPSRTESPRVWLVMGEKPGDNAQVTNLARAIGWDFEEKKIVVKPQWAEGKPRVRPSLDHLDLERSDSLEPPWPDLVITAGRRLSSVGMWIKQASAGHTRLVMIGKPRRLLESVDLAVVAAHYTLPEGSNVARHDLPLMHADPDRLERAAELWRPLLADMRRPLTALMVGGRTGGLRFDLAAARELFEKTLESVEASGGSLYVSTSRRTPASVVEWLREACSGKARLYVFDPTAKPEENPYFGLLGLADRFVVTTDSISMMVEPARLSKTLLLHPLESEIGLFERLLEKLGLIRRLSPRRDPIPAGGFRARMMFRLGRPVHSRDLSAIPRLLVAQGRASWLGDDVVTPPPFADDALETVAARIRAMLGDAPAVAEGRVAD